MTYKQWCEHSKEILAEAEEYNKWRRETKEKLLTDIGPRIAKLGKRGYRGYGFHYALERSFGRLVAELALPWQPSASHCAKVEEDRDKAMINQIIFEDLIEQIQEAEKV